MKVPRGCRVGIQMYCRRLGGLVGVGCGFSWKCYRNLDESAAKSGVVV